MVGYSKLGREIMREKSLSPMIAQSRIKVYRRKDMKDKFPRPPKEGWSYLAHDADWWARRLLGDSEASEGRIGSDMAYLWKTPVRNVPFQVINQRSPEGRSVLREFPAELVERCEKAFSDADHTFTGNDDWKSGVAAVLRASGHAELVAALREARRLIIGGSGSVMQTLDQIDAALAAAGVSK